MQLTEIFNFLQTLNKSLSKIQKVAKAEFYIKYTDDMNDTEIHEFINHDIQLFDFIQEYFDDELLHIIYTSLADNDLKIIAADAPAKPYNILKKGDNFKVEYLIQIEIFNIV